MNDTHDGEYFAIKGFLYQFDKTLIEVLRNPNATVSFENVQDIDYEDYVLQIKHKETQDYSPSKIQKAVGQLLNLFAANETLRIILYCHFKDQTVRDWQPTLAELDAILSEDAKAARDEPLRRRFLERFTIRFSEDYDAQFDEAISLIRNSFSLGTEEEAIFYHSIFRSRLLDRSVLAKDKRNVCYNELKAFASDAEDTVFQKAYVRHLGAEKYEKLLRQQYFTFKDVNIEKFERLFIVECDPNVHHVDVMKIVTGLSRKYFRPGKSPPPYVAFVGLQQTAMRDVKRALRDQDVRFFDGTYFDGDRFRLNDLVRETVNDKHPVVKVVPETEVKNLAAAASIREIYQFYIGKPVDIVAVGTAGVQRHIRIQIDQTAQILRITS